MIIGIDPDAKAHGVAFYSESGLVDLQMLTLPELLKWMKGTHAWVIENVSANNATFRTGKNKAIQGRLGNNVGKCQQAQIELVRMLEHFGQEVILKPISSSWKKEKGQFKLITGWTGKSNEDTRSAAYFGYLEWSKQYGQYKFG